MRYFEDHPVLAREALESLSTAIALIDERGAIGDLNVRLTCLSGYAADDLLGQHIRMIVPSLRPDSPLFCRLERSGETDALESWTDDALSIQCRDGSNLSISLTGSRLILDGQKWTLAVIEDNTSQVKAEQARVDAEVRSNAIERAASTSIAQSEQRFRLAFEGNMAPMVFSSRDGIFLEVNDSYCQMTGRSREELVGRDSKHFTYPEDIGITEEVNDRINTGETDQVQYSKRFLHKNGRIVITEVSICSARDVTGNATYFISSVRDVTEERALASQLSYQALHDPLTGLANRALFDDHLVQARERIARQGGLGAVLLLDLDDFKGVNDTYGHLIGDQLLVGIARRLELVTRSADTLCRFGGDEFLYLAEGLTSPTQADEVAGRLLEVLTEPFSFNGIDLVQHASIGVVVCDGAGTNDRDYVQEADVALYEAKRLRSGRHLVFNSSMQQKAISRFSLSQELRHALQAGELSMHYQPIVDLATTGAVGFEALMRWHHPERGWVPPNVFIPLAEQSDLILELGAFALHESVATACSWEPQG